MNLTTLRQKIETYISTNWTATSVQYTNVPFTRPKNAPWISVHILPGLSFIETIGTGGFNKITGIIIIMIYVPEDTGSGTAWGYADTLRGLFNRKKVDVISFSTPYAEAKGIEDGYFRVAVTAPFFFFEKS